MNDTTFEISREDGCRLSGGSGVGMTPVAYYGHNEGMDEGGRAGCH